MNKIIILVVLSLAIISCNDQLEVENPDIKPNPTSQSDCISETQSSPELSQINSAVAELGLKVVNKLSEAESGNVVISPLSIYAALMMLYEGADCNTYNQIINTLGLKQDSIDVDVASQYLDFVDQLQISNDSTSLKLANALFSDSQRITLDEDFENTLTTLYQAQSTKLNFDEPSALDDINNWAAENTEDRIKEVLDEISGEDVLFIMNALYMVGNWENGFPTTGSFENTFTLSDGTEIMVPIMAADAERLSIINQEINLVDLPISDGFAASFIMPADETVSIDEFLTDELTMNKYSELVRDSLSKSRLYLTIPKFELSGDYSLNAIMASIGMPDAFNPSSANLTRLGTASGNLYVSKFKHDTYLKVDEAGIEGAAVTTIGIAVTSAPPSIYFNRPFAIIVRHQESGVPIFIGKIENPLE